MKIIGSKINLTCIALCVAIWMLIGSQLLCSCITKEGMTELKVAIKSNITDINFNEFKKIDPKFDYIIGPKIPPPEGQLDMFSSNEFSPNCCLGNYSPYSSYGGCACITRGQADFLNSRGFNRGGNDTPVKGSSIM